MPTSTFRDPGTGRAFSFKHEKGLTRDQLQALANEKRFEGLKGREILSPVTWLSALIQFSKMSLDQP